MAWFRLDDQGAFHAKVLAAGNEAYGAWVRAGQWSSGQGTEGRIPKAVALSIAPMRIWKKLVDATGTSSIGLIEADGTDFVIHDFLDWNPTVEEVAAKREAKSKVRSEAGKRGAAARWQPDGKLDGKRDGKLDGKRDGKTMANGMAKRWQTDGPDPDPDPDPDPKIQDPHPNPPAGRATGARAVATLRRLRPAPDAKSLHDAAERALSAAGFAVDREFPVADRGDGRQGFVDLVARCGTEFVAVELDRERPREKSIRKLSQVESAYRIVVLRDAPPGVAQDSRVECVIGLADDDRVPVQARAFNIGTAAAEELASTFETALGEALGRRVAVPNERWVRQALCDAANTHFRGDGSVLGALAAVRGAVADWVDACRDAPHLTSGWSPRRFLAWANEREAEDVPEPPGPEDEAERETEVRRVLTDEERELVRQKVLAAEAEGIGPRMVR